MSKKQFVCQPCQGRWNSVRVNGDLCGRCARANLLAYQRWAAELRAQWPAVRSVDERARFGFLLFAEPAADEESP